jgi:hypothetical protein
VLIDIGYFSEHEARNVIISSLALAIGALYMLAQEMNRGTKGSRIKMIPVNTLSHWMDRVPVGFAEGIICSGSRAASIWWLVNLPPAF